jgi:hypothetical protein
MTNCLDCRWVRTNEEDHVCSCYCDRPNFSMTGKRLFWRIRLDWDCDGFEERARIKWVGIGKSRIKFEA